MLKKDSTESKQTNTKPKTSTTTKTTDTDTKATTESKQTNTNTNDTNTESTSKEYDAADAAIAKAEAAAKAAAEAELALKVAMERAESAKAAAEIAAEEEYKAIASEVKAETKKTSDYTFKRQSEEIFRREMGEPEFFLDKKDRFPRPILSQDEQESLTHKAEIPQDQTPPYKPERVLSPEFGGLSNYERGIDTFLEDAEQNLEQLKKDPESTQNQIAKAQEKIIYLKSLHENYFIGMNVFRTAKGGRSKIRA